MSERSGLSIFDNDTTASPAPAAPPAAAGAKPSFPFARRGYDTSSVDKKISALGGERDQLARSLAEQQGRVASLEAELASLREQASENAAPTYAGLGGKASELLRLAEEQADEVIGSARARADEIVRTATAEAATLRNQASRDAEDMRMVQLKELDEARTSAMGEISAPVRWRRPTPTT